VRLEEEAFKFGIADALAKFIVFSMKTRANAQT
jgi:hypothetical protein